MRYCAAASLIYRGDPCGFVRPGCSCRLRESVITYCLGHSRGFCDRCAVYEGMPLSLRTKMTENGEMFEM